MWKFQEGIRSTELRRGNFSKVRLGIIWSLNLNMDRAVFCQKPAEGRLFSLYANVIEICVLYCQGTFGTVGNELIWPDVSVY